MSYRGTVVQIQEAMAKVFYVAKAETNFVWAQNPYYVDASIKLKLLGVPSKGGTEARYYVSINFDQVPVKDSPGYFINFTVYVVTEGGHYARWSMKEAAAFLDRSMLRHPKLNASVTVAKAGSMARLWTVKRREALGRRAGSISLSGMTSKALALDQKANGLQVGSARAMLYRQIADNLRNAAYFGDLIRGNVDTFDYGNQTDDPFL